MSRFIIVFFFFFENDNGKALTLITLSLLYNTSFYFNKQAKLDFDYR